MFLLYLYFNLCKALFVKKNIKKTHIGYIWTIENTKYFIYQKRVKEHVRYRINKNGCWKFWIVKLINGLSTINLTWLSIKKIHGTKQCRLFDTDIKQIWKPFVLYITNVKNNIGWIEFLNLQKNSNFKENKEKIWRSIKTLPLSPFLKKK